MAWKPYWGEITICVAGVCCVARNLKHHSLWLKAEVKSLPWKAGRVHTETSRRGTAVDKVTSSWAEARADLVAQVCTPRKAKAPSPSWEAGLHSL